MHITRWQDGRPVADYDLDREEHVETLAENLNQMTKVVQVFASQLDPQEFQEAMVNATDALVQIVEALKAGYSLDSVPALAGVDLSGLNSEAVRKVGPLLDNALTQSSKWEASHFGEAIPQQEEESA